MTEQEAREILEGDLGINLAGPQGNAWAVLGLTRGFLKDNLLPEEDISEAMSGARDGDYAHLLIVCAQAVLRITG